MTKQLIKKPEVRRKRTTYDTLIYSMKLDELLEASEIVEHGIKGEKLPESTSVKARQFAEKVLQLNQYDTTRKKAEKMKQALNLQIISINRKTTDKKESTRLYRKLMAEK